jgi:hypothetical protein
MPIFKEKNYPLRTGMIVKFKKPKWEKRYQGRWTKRGNVEITGKIIHDSYGKETNQHTFTILDNNGKKHFIKGRHLYESAEILDLGDYSVEDLFDSKLDYD